MTPNTNPHDLPTLPIWTQRAIAERYNSDQQLRQITLWSTDPTRHPARTPRAVHMARTTWRWGCGLLTGLLWLSAAGNLLALLWGSYTPLMDLAAVLGCGCAGAVPYAWRDMPPAWYVRAVAEMGGGERHDQE